MYNALYFAPMEGITDFMFRRAHSVVFPGDVDKYFTPFISMGQNKKMNPREKRDILPENQGNYKLAVQIMANRSVPFIAVAKEIASYGYKDINLNLGCPSGIVFSKKKGAGFLSVPDDLDRFLDEIFEGCKDCATISVKTRIGVKDPDEFDRILQIFDKYPISELIVHPRLRSDFYKNTPNLDAFSKTLGYGDRLCYNGDINSVSDTEAFWGRFPDVHKIMIGRGLVANPALAGEIKGGDKLSLEQMKHFHELLLEDNMKYQSGERNVLYHMKELWPLFGKSFTNFDKYGKEIRKAQRLCDYKAAVNTLFGQQQII